MGSWWNRQKAFDAGTEFLRSGSTSGFDRLGYGYMGETSSNSGGCRNSGDCGSGFGCVNGECIQTGGSGGNISGSSSASCGSSYGGGSDGGGGGQCGGGGGGGFSSCSQPSCGGGGFGGRGGGAPENCCGERCCRYGSFGVQCYCGPCPPPGRCQKYCDAFYKSNNRDAEGCGEPTKCSECETCQQVQGFWTQCVPDPAAPCHCEQGKCSQCERCGEDGSCENDCSSCQTCVTMYNIDCGCKQISVRCCNSACSSAYPSYDKCREKACSEACPGGGGGTCGQQCDTITVPCPCPSGYSQVGQISAGGETVCICQDCSDDPNCDPDPCDCNCNNDCGDCEICNAAGECVPDPACEETYVCRIFYTVTTDIDSCNTNGCDQGGGGIGAVTTRRTVIVRVKDFDFAAETWRTVGTEEQYSNEGCAIECGMPTPTVTGLLYQPGSEGTPVTSPNAIAGGVGINSLAIIDYSFSTSTGYGSTLNEALEDARAGLPS